MGCRIRKDTNWPRGPPKIDENELKWENRKRAGPWHKLRCEHKNKHTKTAHKGNQHCKLKRFLGRLIPIGFRLIPIGFRLIPIGFNWFQLVCNRLSSQSQAVSDSQIFETKRLQIHIRFLTSQNQAFTNSYQAKTTSSKPEEAACQAQVAHPSNWKV